MDKNWEYSKLAHEAKIHGGPQKYLEFIREKSMQVGRAEGRIEGKEEGKKELLTLEGIFFVAGILIYTGYKVYSGIKEKKERESINKQNTEVKKVETMLIDEINMVNDIAEKNNN